MPALAVGQRTRLYTVGTTATRATSGSATPGPAASPWTGIARLHFPAVAGLDAVVAEADVLAGTLPRYAGVAHRDPRAPVNLTPVTQPRAPPDARRSATPSSPAVPPATPLVARTPPMTARRARPDPGVAPRRRPGRRDACCAASPVPRTSPAIDRRNDLDGLDGDPGRHRGRARRRVDRRHHRRGRWCSSTTRVDLTPGHVRRQPAAPRRRHRAVPLRHRHRGDRAASRAPRWPPTPPGSPTPRCPASASAGPR